MNRTGPLVSSLELLENYPYLRLFPVRPTEKTPCIMKWQEKATGDAQKLVDLWNMGRRVLGVTVFGGGYPDVGIATGKPGSVFVVDCDSPDAAVWFEATFELPGPHVTTSRGGHYYFKCPENVDDIPRNSASRIYPRGDVRGVGGLVVAPPSTRKAGGRYEWTSHCETSFPYVPSALLLAMCKPPAKPMRVYAESQFREHVGESLQRIVRYKCQWLRAAGEGERNERLYKVAFLFGSMARGAPAERNNLLYACQDLIRIAVALGLPEREAARTAEGAFDSGGRLGDFGAREGYNATPSDPWTNVGDEL